MLRKILGISIVLASFTLLFLALRWVWVSGGVFGNDEIIDTNDSQQIAPQQETGDVSSGLVLGDRGDITQIDTGQHQSAPTLSIAMPGWMYNASRQIFFARMEKDLGLTINFFHPGTLGEYQQVIGNATGIDLSLIPSTWFNSIVDKTARVRLPNDMLGSLRPERQSLLLDPQGTFFPYLVDPPVIFHTIPLKNNSWSELLGQTLRNPEYTSFAFVRGRDSITQSLWEKGGEILPSHLALWSTIISSMKSYIQPAEWESFVSMIQKNSSWNTLRLRSWSTNQEDPYCVDYLPGCLFNAGETSITLGYLSDLIARKRYYPNHNRQEISFSPLPLAIGQYPTRGWGWTISNDSPHHEELLQIMEAYMVGSAQQQYNFRSNTDLSPFIAGDISQRQRPSFNTLAPYRYRMELSVGTWNDHREILEDTRLIKVLNGEFDPALYFE